MRSGAMAALSVAGVLLEIHKALLYSHPVGPLLWGSFLPSLLRALGALE